MTLAEMDVFWEEAKQLAKTQNLPAAKAGDKSMTEKKRDALIEFEPKLEITRKLVTLVDSLELPRNTRI